MVHSQAAHELSVDGGKRMDDADQLTAGVDDWPRSAAERQPAEILADTGNGRCSGCSAPNAGKPHGRRGGGFRFVKEQASRRDFPPAPGRSQSELRLASKRQAR